MNKVFEPIKLAGITFPNRIIRSATYEGMSDKDGKPTEQLLKKYTALAKGGVGGIITGFIGVNQQGKSTGYYMSMINKAETVKAYRELTSKMHELGTPIIAQLNHCGGQTKKEATGMPVIAPSKIADYKAKEMTKVEILEVIEAFVQGVKNAKEAGFDGVQIHVAHGYLLSEFVSPRMNRRTDEWGGTTENRFRIVKTIFEKARKEVGDYPMIVKMKGYETLKNGMTIQESVKIAKLLINNDKCDAVSMSRPFIIEFDLVNKFKTGKQTQAKCIQCNFCIIVSESGPLRCYYGKLPAILA